MAMEVKEEQKLMMWQVNVYYIDVYQKFTMTIKN